MQIDLKTIQADFIGAREQFPAYIAGIGTGKSTALIAKAMFESLTSDNNLGVIVRKNFTDLRDSTLRDFEDYTGLRVNRDTKEVKLDNNSTIMFRHGDELPTLKNLNLGWFAIEQAEEFNDSLSWDMLTQRLRRKVKFRTGFLIANANGHNWIWQKWIKDGPPKNHLTLQATTYDFKDVLPPDYIENLESNLPKKMFRRFVLNSHEEAEGLVFDEFNNSHIVDPFPIPGDWTQGYALDHGFRNPTAVLWWAKDYDDNLYIYDEHYKKEMGISDHAKEIKKRNITDGIADPSIFNKTQAKHNTMLSIADEYRDFDIHLSPAIREELKGSIARVNELFKANKIKVFSSCKNHIWELQNWKWQEMKPGYDKSLPEKPEDKNDHSLDCLRYIVVTRYLSPAKKEKPAPRHSVQTLLREIDYMKQQNSPESFWND